MKAKLAWQGVRIDQVWGDSARLACGHEVHREKKKTGQRMDCTYCEAKATVVAWRVNCPVCPMRDATTHAPTCEIGNYFAEFP